MLPGLIKRLFPGKPDPEQNRPVSEWQTREVVDPNGRKWRVFGDGHSPTIIPANRFFPTELAIIQVNNSISDEELDKTLEYILDSFNRGEIAKIAHAITELKIRRSLCAPLNCWLMLACSYVLIDDEPENSYIKEYQDRKMKYWAENPESGFFFANIARQSIPDYSTISSQDFRASLQAVEVRKRALSDYLLFRR